MKGILMAKGLYEITNGQEQSVENELKANWLLKDVRAQEVLVTRIDEGSLSHLMQCTTASQMWEKLESIYDRKSGVSMHLLNKQFYELKFECGDVNSFVSKVTTLSAKMKQQGEELPEKMIITKIIMALPLKFRHFRSAWESVPVENQTINNLTARLLVEEERLGKENKREETVALVSRKFDKKCFNCGKTGCFKSQCRQNLECNYCKKKGHTIKNCFLKKQRATRNSNDRKDQSDNNDKSFALIVLTNEIIIMINNIIIMIKVLH